MINQRIGLKTDCYSMNIEAFAEQYDDGTVACEKLKSHAFTLVTMDFVCHSVRQRPLRFEGPKLSLPDPKYHVAFHPNKAHPQSYPKNNCLH